MTVKKDYPRSTKPKTCPKCKLLKTAEEFYTCRSNKDGLITYCIPCQAINDRLPRNRYSKLRAKLKREEGVDFLLTYEQWAELNTKPCHYCKRAINSAGRGVDRVIPGGDYHIGNVVPCCGTCNSFKGSTLTAEEMLAEIGPAIARIQAKREAAGLPLIENAMPRSAFGRKNR
jgi:hypothetical protein